MAQGQTLQVSGCLVKVVTQNGLYRNSRCKKSLLIQSKVMEGLHTCALQEEALGMLSSLELRMLRRSLTSPQESAWLTRLSWLYANILGVGVGLRWGRGGGEGRSEG